MPATIHPFPDVSDKARTLGCQDPALFSILPRNFDTATTREELIHESNADTVRTLFRNAKILETPLENPGERFFSVQENDFTWTGPILFVSAAMLTENQHFLSVALGVVSNYLTDFFKGVTGNKKVIFDLVLEQTKAKKCVRIHFEGSAEDFSSFANSVDGVIQDECIDS